MVLLFFSPTCAYFIKRTVHGYHDNLVPNALQVGLATSNFSTMVDMRVQKYAGNKDLICPCKMIMRYRYRLPNAHKVSPYTSLLNFLKSARPGLETFGKYCCLPQGLNKLTNSAYKAKQLLKALERLLTFIRLLSLNEHFDYLLCLPLLF